VLFFTAPPVEFEGGTVAGSLSGTDIFLDGVAETREEQLVGHSTEYTAWRLREASEREALREKRRREVEEDRESERVKRIEETSRAMETLRDGLMEKTMKVWAEQLNTSTKELQEALRET
jgi:hypothetical protein